MPGGDSIEERGTSMPKGLGDSDAIVKECHEGSHLRSRDSGNHGRGAL
jgi:hypothetical protein